MSDVQGEGGSISQRISQRISQGNSGGSSHAIRFILITILIDSLGFGMIAPVMPELISELTGEGFAEAARYGGQLMFLFALV